MSKQMPFGLRSCLSTWQNWKEQRGKKREGFFIEENKYGGMETGWSTNRSGLGWLSGSKGFQPQPFPMLHHLFCDTHNLSGWGTHPWKYHIQACNSIKSVAHQGKSFWSNFLRITDQLTMLMSSLNCKSPYAC